LAYNGTAIKIIKLFSINRRYSISVANLFTFTAHSFDEMNALRRKISDAAYPLWKRYNNIRSVTISYPHTTDFCHSLERSKMIAYNRERFWGAKKLFCYNAFSSMFFDIFGNVVACCRSHKNVLGTYPAQRISEIWNGEGYRKMREHMRCNDLSNGCEYCAFQINTGRFRSLPSTHIEEVVKPRKLGKYPLVMEFELANTCNLQCVMCSGRVSSSIRKHREQLPAYNSPYDDAFVEQLKEFIPHLKHAYFFGGEPFLIDIYYKIWDEIIRLNPKIKLFAVTNGTVMNDRVKHVLSHTNFNAIVSLDSLDQERDESIRVGSQLEKVLENIKTFDRLTGNKISISHTPMTLNWQDTPDILKLCIENNYRVNLSYIERPSKFALWAQMPEYLEKVYEYYKQVDWSRYKKGFNAQNNVKLFKEWMAQVAYFRDKNQEILQSFTSLKEDCEKLSQIILEKLDQAYAHFNISDIEGAGLKAEFIRLIGSTTPTPWFQNGLQDIGNSLSDFDSLRKENLLPYIEAPGLLCNFLNEKGQHEFFEAYY